MVKVNKSGAKNSVKSNAAVKSADYASKAAFKAAIAEQKNETKSAVVEVKAETKGVEATAKAVVLTLDVKANHSMRVTAAKSGIDLYATHSQDKTSKGYVEQLSAVKREVLFKEVSKGDVRLLVVNGVCNLVRIDSKGAFYGRNGVVVVRDFTLEQMLHGNVASLQALYGDAVRLYTEEQTQKLFDAQKEQITRTVGTGKHKTTVTGRIIATGRKGDTTLDVVAVKGAKGLMFINCEDHNNEHNYSHRFVQEQSTVAK